jgi:hypothetical protein
MNPEFAIVFACLGRDFREARRCPSLLIFRATNALPWSGSGPYPSRDFPAESQTNYGAFTQQSMVVDPNLGFARNCYSRGGADRHFWE